MTLESNKNKKQRGGGITHISSFFKKYTDVLKTPPKHIIDSFINIVKENEGLTIKKEYCSYNTNSKILFLNAPGPLKTEVLLKKQHLLTLLNKQLGPKNSLKDIL